MNVSLRETRWSIFLTLFVLGLITAIVILPSQFHSEAGENKASNEPTPEKQKMYDIREDKYQYKTLAGFRERNGKDAAFVADSRDAFVRGEEAIKTRLPHVKIEYNTDIRTPEVITPDVWQNEINFLSAPSGQKRSEILRSFLKQNNDLVGVTDGQAEDLNVAADYANPDGNISYAHLEQLIDGVPVFRGEVKAGFTKDGRIIRVINNLAPGLDYASLSRDFKNPVDAVAAASRYLGRTVESFEGSANAKQSTDLKVVFGSGDWATTAEKMYFPTEPGIAVPAWRVLVWGPADPHYVIVDAETGVTLWSKNISDEQTQAATYQIYGNPNAYIDVADSPAPFSPGPVNPTLGQQALNIARTNRTLIGNEGDLSFNNNGWITDNTNITDGNFTEAGIDNVAPNGVDATQVGSPNRVFDSTWVAPPAAGASDILNPQAQRGAVIQMFYVMNRWHDALYKVGFTEAARNFQHDNFGRGGNANDRVSSEGQDDTQNAGSCPAPPCYNNANFATPADGSRPRMQMYKWNGPTPDYDGTADAEIIIHEVTHGLSNRLHGNGSGLGNQGGMMGEGWGDWYANTLLAEPSDPIDGVYGTGGYATYQGAGLGYLSNYYYGIRRFPRAVITAVGPNGRPHSPLSFRHINSNCNTEIGSPSVIGTISAYPRGNFGSSTCSQVHAAGEIWSVALWEVRARFVTRDGFQNGTTRVLQVVTDGMKLAPLGPTFLQERDAIIAAAAAMPNSAGAVADVRDGFRVRGMGFSASVQSNTSVTEAFDAANAIIVDPFSVSDSTGDNDGYPEPGESVLLNVSITNTTGSPVTNVVGNVAGGGSANYGTIAHNQTVTRQIAYTIPSLAPCASTHSVNITATSDIGVLTPQTRSFPLGVPAYDSPTQNFDSVTAPALPLGWTEVHTGSSIGWTTTTTNATSAPNAVFVTLPATTGETTLTGTAQITSATATLSFRNRFNTEATWDGSVLDISIGGAPFQDILAAGGSFVSGGYTGAMDPQSPIGTRAAWSGASAGTGIDTVINLPASANGQTVRFNFRTFSDAAVSVTNPGVWYDNMQLTGGNFLSNYTCGIVSSNATVSGRVVDSAGRSISRAGVTLTNGGNSIHAVTNTFGYFYFPVTTTGTAYNLTVTAKRHTFAPQTLTPTGNVTGLVITANP